MNLSEQYGGGGGGIYDMQIVGEELAAAGCPLLMTVVSPTICGTIIQAFGSEELKQQWLPGIASGETIMAFAITEPDAGSNSHNISTTAKRDGDDWVINGTKYYISGVDEAEAILVVTRTSTNDSGRGLLSLLVVPTDVPGLTKSLIPVQAVTPEKQFTLFFDDVRVPAANLIGAENEGLRQVFMGLNPERIMGRRSATASVATRWIKPPITPATATCGERRSARTKAYRTRSPTPRSRLSWPG